MVRGHPGIAARAVPRQRPERQSFPEVGFRASWKKEWDKAEEFVAKLRQVGVLVSHGRSVAGAVQSIGVTEFGIIALTHQPLNLVFRAS